MKIRKAIAAALLGALLAVTYLGVAGGATPVYLSDNFSGGALSPQLWRYWWGEVAVISGKASLQSRPPLSSDETHSALITSKGSWKNYTLSLEMKTVRRLRLNDPPNTWEVGWAMLRFRDLNNYYYFILKPNGFELGKKHGSDAQLFLVTGDSMRLTVGKANRVTIRALGANIAVWVDGAKIIDYTDPEPILSGSVGLYEEDAHVLFDSVKVSPDTRSLSAVAKKSRAAKVKASAYRPGKR